MLDFVMFNMQSLNNNLSKKKVSVLISKNRKINKFIIVISYLDTLLIHFYPFMYYFSLLYPHIYTHCLVMLKTKLTFKKNTNLQLQQILQNIIVLLSYHR